MFVGTELPAEQQKQTKTQRISAIAYMVRLLAMTTRCLQTANALHEYSALR